MIYPGGIWPCQGEFKTEWGKINAGRPQLRSITKASSTMRIQVKYYEHTHYNQTRYYPDETSM